ncbi:MAG TPA: hypothetical protein VFP65_02540 [Anaeromyxobacteraceae bacterium]|nr:hypothetical protein [Anaeromyxobacteraceae bacterium]
MKTWMRVLSLSVTVLTAGSARAEVKVADDVWNGSARFSGLDYGVNEQSHRAWLVLHFLDDGPCRDSDGRCEIDEPVRVAVPGLTYDPATRRVLYGEGTDAQQTCANVVHHTFLGSRDTVEPTGNCGHRVVKVDRVVDDGFDGRKDKRAEVLFGASPAANQ